MSCTGRKDLVSTLRILESSLAKSNGSREEYPNQSKLQLINFEKDATFSKDQIKMMISFLKRITETHDYALPALLPELIELL